MTRLFSAMFVLVTASVFGQTVSPKQASYDIGDNIEVDFAGGPGNATDWVGIYQPGNVPDGDPSSTAWFYTNGTQTAGGNATDGTVTFPAGTLAAGDYAVWFLENDGYTALAGPVALTIRQVVEPVEVSWVVADFHRRHGIADQGYTGKIDAYVRGDDVSLSKLSGPAWLSISPTGVLSGTPAMGDVGLNEFQVRATQAGATKDATLRIEVCKENEEVVRELKVMSYNAWHGWGQMNDGHQKGLESIIISGADIIGMQESTDSVSGSGVYQPLKIATDLGWHYRGNLSGSLGIISRYPITDETLAAGDARGAKIQVTASPKREVILMNCHLDYRRYGPYAAQLAGATEQSVLTEEKASQRDEQITAIMAAFAPLLASADDIPVFYTGDFNAPSHLDWTPATAANHGGVGNVAWPTSTAVLGGGMKDSYREVHPAPEAKAGNTWSPIFKGGEAQDRIDLVYFKGKSVKPVASEVFTTAVEVTVGAWGSSSTPTQNNTWPSDHASMVSTFKLASVDADDDGMCDVFEQRHFGGTAAETGAGDADGDGVSNANEELFASDPTDRGSRPSLGLNLDGDTKISFSFSESAFERNLICEKSADLRNWNTVWSYQEDPALGSGVFSPKAGKLGVWDGEVADEDDMAKMFYRLRSQ